MLAALLLNPAQAQPEPDEPTKTLGPGWTLSYADRAYAEAQYTKNWELRRKRWLEQQGIFEEEPLPPIDEEAIYREMEEEEVVLNFLQSLF